MADLDFKHQVHEIPKGAELPTSQGRKVAPITTNVPDFQGAVNKYAEATNWMSSLGSAVATRASNAIATKLGGEMGKNPQGDLPLPITNFDKVMAESYATQANVTLGLQAQTLISKTNLELAQKPRLTSDMIASAQQSTLKGLEKIFSMAPSSERPKLEAHFGNTMINQNERLVEKMISDQKTDRIQNLELSSQVSSENAHSLTLSGNDKGAEAAMNSTIAAARSAAARHDITPAQAKVIEDTVRQSLLSGKMTRLALEADKNKKLPELYKSIADNPEKYGISDKDHQAVINNVAQYMNMQATLRLQDQQLRIAKFETQLAEDAKSVTGSQFSALQELLTPLQAQQAKLKLVQALNKQKDENLKSDALIADWGNSAIHARAGEKAQNQTFDKLTQKVVQDASGSISHDQAEIMVANSAGAVIPVFTKTLQDKLGSGNPVLMESAAQQMHSLYQMGAGHALAGLSDKDKAMFGAIESLRGSLNPTEAMQEAINKIYNQDPTIFKANQQKWSDYISLHTKGGVSDSDFALKNFGYSKDNFLNPSVAQVYGTDMLQKYSTYYQLLGGDEKTAKAVTQRYIDENYGDTGVNGGKHSTLHPLEKVLGYSSSDVVPYIQRDVINQLESHFKVGREAYANKQANEYWEVEPLPEKRRGAFFQENHPIQIKHYVRDGGKKTSQTFDVVLQGNAFDNWDVAVYSKSSGLRPLVQVAGYLGVINYIPNKKAIDADYLKGHS